MVQVSNQANFVIYSPNESAISAGAGFWSNEQGWVAFAQATVFTEAERNNFTLPLSTGQDALWCSADEAAKHYCGAGLTVEEFCNEDGSFSHFSVCIAGDVATGVMHLTAEDADKELKALQSARLTAQALAGIYGHVNADSATTLASATLGQADYELRVCGFGPEAFFEWIDDGGDPVGSVLDTIESVEAEARRFAAWRELYEAHSESEEEGPNGRPLPFYEWLGKASADPYHEWHQQAKAFLGQPGAEMESSVGIVVTFKQDGGAYGLRSGYGYWSAFVANQRIDFCGSLETPSQREAFVAKYYPGAATVEVPRDVQVSSN